MASIRPFRGVRYDPAEIGNLDAVVTPPYDIISETDREWYEKRHPYNIVRLILPQDEAGTPGSKYQAAATRMQQWLHQGILIRDKKESIYACVQEFSIAGIPKTRLGFTCLVRLEDFGNGRVLPHENIMTKPLEDRLNLMRFTRANLDSVFGLYSGTEAHQIVQSAITNPPDAQATDRGGVRCSLHIISNPETIAHVKEALAPRSVIIADGHHRYYAALAYRDEMRARAGSYDPKAPYEYIMMTLVSTEDAGLVVLPTHRLVGGLRAFRPDKFLSNIAKLFDISETTPNNLLESVESRMEERHVFGLYIAGKAYVLKLKDTAADKVKGPPGSDGLKQLDVSVLHELILNNMLGITPERLAQQINVTYTRDVKAAIKQIDRGERQMLFVMNPTRVSEVKEVAAAGERMPQKSTFFYPKLLTGMVIRLID